MKRKEGYLLRKIGMSYMIVPIKDGLIQIEGMLTLNETGAFLWEQLKEEKTKKELLEAILSEYDVDKEIASTDIQEFLEKTKRSNILSE